MNQNTLKILNKLYDEFSYLGKKDFLELVSESDPKKKYVPPPKNVLLEWYNKKTSKNPGKQLLAKRDPKIKNYKVAAVPGSYQMDLVFFYLDIPWLMLIHVPSRYVWIWKLKRKTTAEVYACLLDWYYQKQKNHIVENERFVNTITSDQENAFMSKKIQAFCAEHGIKYYVKDTTEHYPLLILDTAVRRIKDLFQYNLANDKVLNNNDFDIDNEEDVNKHIKLLDELVYKSVGQHNKKPMAVLEGNMPVEVYYGEDFQNKLYEQDTKYNNKAKRHNDRVNPLEVGDYVKIMQRKTSKIQKARYWSDKVYRIIAKFRFSYQVGLIDKNNNIIEVDPISNYRFKPFELQKVSSDTSSNNINRELLLSKLKQHKSQIRQNMLGDSDFRLKNINKQVKPVPSSSVTTRSKRGVTKNINSDYYYY